MAIKINKEVKIGILVATAVIFLVLGFNFLRGRSFFSNEDVLYVHYEDVTGLVESSVITLKGVHIGKVTKLELQPDRRVKVEFIITDKNFKVPVGSQAQLVSDNMLAGSKRIDLILANNNSYLKSGDTVQGLASAGMFDNLSQEVAPVMRSVQTTIGNVDTILLSVNEMLNAQAKQHINQTVASMDVAMAEMATLTRALNQQTENLNAVMKNVNSVTGNLANNNAKVSNILANTEQISDKLNRGKVDETLHELQKASASLQQTISRINNSNGSLNMLITDRKLYDNLSTSLSSLDTVLTDLKKRPSRYINLSVFGRQGDR